MKNWKNQKYVGITAIIAVFGFSTSGLAEAHKRLPLKEGVSLTELKAISNNSAEAVVNGNTLRFAGTIPAECAAGANLSSQHEDGRHVITIRLAEKCEKAGYTPDAKAKRVHLSQALNMATLQDKSGELVVVFKSRGSDDPMALVKASKGEKLGISIEGSAELAAKAEKEKQEELDRQRLDVAKDLEKFCNSDDFAGLGEAVESNRALLGDLADAILAKGQDIELAGFKKKLEKAESGEGAKKVLEAFQDYADAKGLDRDSLNEAYIAKRGNLVHEQVVAAKSDSKLKLDVIAKEIQAWNKDLKRLDRKKAQSMESAFAKEIENLGTIASDREDYSSAAKFFQDAAEMVGAKDADAMFTKAVAANVEAFKQCVEKNPMKSSSCDSKYRKPAQKMAEKIMKKKEKAAKKDDDQAEEYMSFSQEYYSVFGGGAQYYQMGYGWMNQMPGSLDTFKYQAMQNAQMEQYQKMMQRMYGGGPQAAGASGGLFSLR